MYSTTCTHTAGDLGCFLDTQVAHCLMPGRLHVIPVFQFVLTCSLPLSRSHSISTCASTPCWWMPRLWGYAPLGCWTPPCSKYSGTLIFAHARSVWVYIPTTKECIFKILVDDANCLPQVLCHFTPFLKSQLSSCCSLWEDSKISLNHSRWKGPGLSFLWLRNHVHSHGYKEQGEWVLGGCRLL